MSNHEINKNSEIAPVIDGMKGLAEAFANLPQDQGLYRRTKLENPTTDTFGTHTEKRELVQGRARIQQEIDNGGTLMFSVFDDKGAKKVVGIGRTPDELRREKGGQFMIGAGRDGIDMPVTDAYFMLVHQGLEDTIPPKPFYISADQLRDITVAPGDEDVTLNPYMENSTNGRQIQIKGRVKNVVVLENPQRH